MSVRGERVLLLRVEGMSCTGCGDRIGKVLSRLGVAGEAVVDLGTAQVRVAYDPGVVAAAVVVERVERAGYRVISYEEVAS